MFARVLCLLVFIGVASVPALADPIEAGSGSSVAATTPASSSPQISDVGTAEKLWKDGSFFGVAILVLYVALFAGWKLDKKRAFYWATAFGGLAILVESIRKGDTPGIGMAVHTLGPTIGLLIAGPNHVTADASSSSN